MLRFLLKRLASEKVIEYLSQTYVIRRAAQMTVQALYRYSNDRKIQDILSAGRFRSILNSFKQNLKKELENVDREIKKKGQK